jgi:hypothetical protein
MLWKYKKCYIETNEDVPDPKGCYSVIFVATGPTPIAFGRVSCYPPPGGESPTITVPGNSQIELCVQSHTNPTIDPTQWNTFLGGNCG